MAETSHLLILLWAVLVKVAVAARLPAEDNPAFVLECGSSAAIPANISHHGRQDGGFFTSGGGGNPARPCQSERRGRKGPGYVHVITDALRPECGAKVSEDGRHHSVTVHVRHYRRGRKEAEETVHTLSCHYDRPFDVHDRHTQIQRRHAHTSNQNSQTAAAKPGHSDFRRDGREIPAEFKSRNISRGFLQARRLYNDVDERLTLEDDVTQTPLALSKAYGHADVRGMSSSASVLQLNVVDKDGSMTGVIYPGKPVALELQAAHHNTLGVPVVTSCKTTNPLDHSSVDNVAIPPFSAPILHHGCGQGSPLPTDSGFAKSRQGYTTPYFLVPTTWTLQTALIFSCDVIICADVIRCQQKCPLQRRKPFTPGLHDITILLESQVVTSCPSADDANSAGDVRWDKSLFPECLPEGHSLHHPLPPSEPDQNITADAVGSDVNKSTSPPSWLAGNLHYVIIISLLVVLVVIFMMATFCKMVAVQRHERRTRKEEGGEARERRDSEQQDQTTQTPRPLPRTPHARSQTPNRHSRQGGDGASVIVLPLDDGQGGASRPPSGVPLPLFDNRRNSLPSPPPVPQLRTSGQPRPQPYDIPPSHEQQAQYRASVSSEPSHSPFLLETSERSSKVKSFQSSTTVEEKNSERHTTIIEIKTPSQREPVENGVAWNAPDHLATFTGAPPTGGSNTLERGVVLGVNSLRRHLDRENQQVSSQPRDRRPITAQQHEPLPSANPVTPQMYYNTPALCSEDSSLKELMLNSCPDGGIAAPTPLGGIRTSPHRGSRKGTTPVIINTVEETTRL